MSNSNRNGHKELSEFCQSASLSEEGLRGLSNGLLVLGRGRGSHQFQPHEIQNLLDHACSNERVTEGKI
jgi:hypothetical protein